MVAVRKIFGIPLPWALVSVLVAPSVFAASATISTNRSAYFLNSGQTLSLSGSIQAGFDAGTVADIYVQAQLNSGIPVFYLGPLGQWTAAVAPIVAGFRLTDVAAPDFYQLPVAGSLPTGIYQFAVMVARAGTNPGTAANLLAYGATTVPFNPPLPAPAPLIFNPPATAGPWIVGYFYQFNYGPYAGDGMPPYRFTLDPSAGSLPAGVTLDANGLLSGTPAAEGDYPFRVCVEDATAAQRCASVTDLIRSPSQITNPAGPTTPSSPPAGNPSPPITNPPYSY